ncbi:MAG TPA: hypothetical protein VGB73_00185 [Pyrinomonadaceae bacterium]|jgi:hypothetical protein
MKLLPVIATLVFALSLCNLTGNRGTSNTNSNASNTNNANSNTTANANSNSSSTSSSSSMSEDDKHKLFQAAGMTKDNALILEVSRKIGLLNSDNTPNDNFQPFIKSHMDWAMKNASFVRDMNDPQKARDYAEKHK